VLVPGPAPDLQERPPFGAAVPRSGMA
jgi:hypothetical protein